MQGEIVEVLKTAWSNGETPTKHELAMRLGEWRALIAEAVKGQLEDDGWCAVARDPNLWELRWRWDRGLGGDRPVEIRGYFHEPAAPSHVTVLVKVHVKSLGGGEEAIRQCQNSHIFKASTRVAQGQATQWCVDKTPPLR